MWDLIEGLLDLTVEATRRRSVWLVAMLMAVVAALFVAVVR